MDDMKIFWIPLEGTTYQDLKARYVGRTDSTKVAARALKHYNGDKEYVENMMDGRGYIEIPAQGGKFRYIQDS